MKNKIIILALIIIVFIVGCEEESKYKQDTFTIEDVFWGNVTFKNDNITWYNYTWNYKDDFECKINKDKGYNGCVRIIGFEFIREVGGLSPQQITEYNQQQCYCFYIMCQEKGNGTIAKQTRYIHIN